MDGVDGENGIASLFKLIYVECKMFCFWNSHNITSADTQPKSKIKFPETSQGMNWMCE